jgi:hypothetical protein
MDKVKHKKTKWLQDKEEVAPQDGAWGGGPGKSNTAKSKRKHSRNKEKDKFEEWHAKNVTQVYSIWQAIKDVTKPTKFWKGLLKADQKAVLNHMLWQNSWEEKLSLSITCAN